MKIVGLVSGGKDSCYNLMKCLQNGHQIICLANLYPPSSNSTDEIDSYMYQSVAYMGVQLYSEACELPLYRREIKGKPMNVDADYKPTDDDEVEDLYELLADVRLKHPDVEGVSVGAILSSYQKKRVENVCDRLNMKVLCYLWGMDQSKLLDEIINSQIDAIVVKVAALGLNSKHISQSLVDVCFIVHLPIFLTSLF
ncbi:unnamed protein product [Anisakis simplex]|uniref:Diphthine--ammonia ligase n=1 Tax=Anisakis simplex TaxID=6269 RepID=A0A0M3JWJ0_ANISI|nr:unnamed protein product [Anisakis simplex]